MQETLKSICIPLALKAGDLLLKEWNSVSIDHFKESEDICTNLDLKVESLLLDTLMKYFPDHNFDSEECGKGPDKKSDYTWILDPIDGSKNYIRHLPFFNISMALQYKGETIFGLVCAPKTEELFFALKGEGAFLLDQEHGEDFVMESTVKLHGSCVKELAKAQIHTELPILSENADKNDQKMYTESMKVLTEIMKKTYRVRSFGSGAIALCYAARGSYDGFIDLSGTSKIYDFAAGLLICEEAGLKVSDINGEKFTNPKKQQLVVAPSHLSKEIIHNLLT
ncbi:MAG: inositol monophosphatase [Candidatus Peregrinibacteria bacterium]|nr:inositol monophosphatase [Candidatus Peregrinibacteria bacterium]MDZ4244806.1 inositol monophosphatase [Candidatus Gracilibacteria bacterium]